MPKPTRDPAQTAEVCLLIKTHALPALSYRIPDTLRGGVSVGSVVVAPLSGATRPGVVIGLGEKDANGRATQYLSSVSEELSLPEALVGVCERVSEASSVALASVLRAALPPGVTTTRYRIVSARDGWKWPDGSLVGKRALKDHLGEDDFREAESEGWISPAVLAPPVPSEEWAVARDPSPDLTRAPRQRAVFERLSSLGGEARTFDLAPKDLPRNGLRTAIRALVSRGAVSLEYREEIRAIRVSSPSERSARSDEVRSGVRETLESRSSLWRTPTERMPEVLAELARAVNGSGGSLLVLAPETAVVDEVVRGLVSDLPAGRRVATYHSRTGGDRGGVWRAARSGELDVLVGTRSASLIPLENLGAVCVVDEPNTSHRASPGHEGLQIHARDIALIRGEIETLPTLLLSPRPSLKTYASVNADVSDNARRIEEIPSLRDAGWPAIRMIDMRGTGAALSSTLLDACDDFLGSGKRVAVVGNRLGHAAVVCGGCGGVRSCPDCDVPFILRESAARDATGTLECGRCGYEEDFFPACPECGSVRHSKLRPSVERVREDLSRALDLRFPVGLVTAKKKIREDSPLVVGTAGPLLGGGRERYDLVVLPDADSFLLSSWMGSTERAFAGIFSAAESAREMLLVQTRNPENHTLRSAVRGDYRAFAASEIPRLRDLGYPPYAHLVSLVFRGRRGAVLRAVESSLFPVLEPGVFASGLVPCADSNLNSGKGFRMILRSVDRDSITRAANRAAKELSRLPAKGPGRVRVSIEIDPEEV